MAFEAYNVSVRLSLINGVSAGLTLLSKEFGKTNMVAKELQGRLDGIKKWALTGAIIGGAGLGILAALRPAMDEAKRFQQELTKFQLYGMGDEANSQAEKFVKSMNVMGSSYVDNMRIMTEAQGIFRESGKRTVAEQLQGAILATPILAKLSVIKSSLSADEQTSRHAQDLAMLRFIEARGGANDPKTFASIADWGYRLSKSSGVAVDWSQLQQLTATAGVAGFNLGQDALTSLEPVIADLKGGRTGSGLRVAFQRLLGTQRGLPKQAVSEFLSLGLWDPSKVELSGGGGIKRFLGQPGDVLKDRQLFATDPVGFYTKDFLPALAKKYGAGILGDSVDARIKRAVEISMVFGPGTSGAVFSQIDKLLPAIARSQGAQAKQEGIDASYAAATGTLAGKELALQKQWRDILEQTGEAVLPLAVQGLSALLPLLKGFSDWAQNNQGPFRIFVQGVAALGVALTVGGAVVELVALGKAIGLLATVFKAGTWIPAVAKAGKALGDLSYVGWQGMATGVGKFETAVAGLGAINFLALAGGIAAFAGATWAADRYIDAWEKKHGPGASELINALRSGGPFSTFTGAGAAAGFDLGQHLRNLFTSPAPKGGAIHPSSYNGGAKLQPIILHLDGKAVGQVVVDRINGALNRSPASGSGFDPSASYTPVGMGALEST